MTGGQAAVPMGGGGAAAGLLLQALGASVVTHGEPRVSLNGTTAAVDEAVSLGGASSELELAAACGALQLTGDPEQPPVWPAAPVCEGLLGLAACYTVLARTLAGSAPDFLTAPDPRRWLTYLMGIARAAHETGVSPRRAGARNPALAPAALYPDTLLSCADGWMHAHYAPSDPDLLATLVEAPGASMPPVAADAGAIDGLLARWLSTRTRQQAADAAQELRHPFVPVATLDELRVAHGAAVPPPVTYRRRLAESAKPPPLRSGALPLAGVRVTELTVAVAGPMAGELLRLLGAEVTRVVHPAAAAAGWYDRGKRMVLADLGTAAGRQRLEGVLAQSDVLLTNLSSRAQHNLRLADALGASAPPGLVSVAITAFPAADPRHLWGAFDAGMQAAVGLADATRYPGGGPLRVAGHPLDAAAALIAACAVLAGVWRRRQTGAGAALDVSMWGAGLLLTAPLLASAGAGGDTAALQGAPTASPSLVAVAERARAGGWLPF